AQSQHGASRHIYVRLLAMVIPSKFNSSYYNIPAFPHKRKEAASRPFRSGWTFGLVFVLYRHKLAGLTTSGRVTAWSRGFPSTLASAFPLTVIFTLSAAVFSVKERTIVWTASLEADFPLPYWSN